jgi:hypothetical protein
MAYETRPWHAAHAEELKLKAREYRANLTPQQKQERSNVQTVYRNKHKDHYRVLEFAREMKKYGTTVEWYRDRLIEQSGVCAICSHLSHHHGTLQRLQVDHNHECCDLRTKSCGKCLRGLLCADCNINLSYLELFLKDALVFPMLGKDNSWTGRALRYLLKYQ